MANAGVRKCMRSFEELHGSKSDVCIEQISRIYNKYTSHLDKEKDVLWNINISCNGKLFPTN